MSTRSWVRRWLRRETPSVAVLLLLLKARPGAPPDVWFRLPAALMEAVDRLVLAEDGAENPLLMRCLVQTAAAVHAHDMRLLQEEHNRQLIALTKQLVDCKKRLTEQEKDYRAQLGAVCRRQRAAAQQVAELKQQVAELKVLMGMRL